MPSHSIHFILASFGGSVVTEKIYRFASSLEVKLVGEITKSFLNKNERNSGIIRY